MTRPSHLAQLQTRIGYEFKNQALLEQALTHRSSQAKQHYERLEYLGDAVINLIISDLLYEALPNLAEGQLSRIRANLVKQESLHHLALKLNLAACLRLGNGENKSGGIQRPSILADAVEALSGAIYLDSDYNTAKRVIQEWLSDLQINTNMSQTAKDAKTQLQEWLQARKMPLAIYTVISITGAAHQQSFEIECAIPALNKKERGVGSTRRSAEQVAAQIILDSIKDVS